MNDIQERNKPGRPYFLFVIFVLLAAAIVIAGSLYYKEYRKQHRREMENQLSVVADLQVNELTRCRDERLGDASLIYQNPLFYFAVSDLFENPYDTRAQASVRTWLYHLQTSFPYRRILLLDSRGIERFSSPSHPAPVSSIISRRVAEVLENGEFTLQDFYRNEHDQHVYLSMLIPVLSGPESGKPIAVLVLMIDPEPILYGSIKQWVTDSKTAETLLVRREGDSVLFLNELRFNKNAALKLRIPLERTEVPSVQAVLGKEGIMRGKDYRGVPVIAALRRVPYAPWFLVAKMDVSEVYGPVRERLRLTLMVIAALLLSAAATVGFLWRQRSIRFYQEQYRAASMLRQARDQLEKRVKERTAELEQVNEALNDLSTKLLNAQEDERKRIAMDLHDSIAASLGAVKLKLQRFLVQTGTQLSADTALSDIITVVDDVIMDVRRIMANLRPSMLDDLGLLPTVRTHLKEFQQLFPSIHVSTHLNIHEEDVPPPLRIIVFRLLQEALNNVGKHSRATEVLVSLYTREGHLTLEVNDNGVGFNPHSLPRSSSRYTGFGLSSMAERARSSGGQFTVDSSPGAGTRIRVSWPRQAAPMQATSVKSEKREGRS